MSSGAVLRKFWIIAFVITLAYQYATAAPNTTPNPDDYDDDDTGGTEASSGQSSSSDDSKVYKNPRNSPSAICPRDEEQATLLGQKCLRKCSSDEDCKSKKKKCLCDGACGMSCIKPDRECPELEQPDIGTVTLSGKLFGDKATYTCPHGYHVVGLQSRSCQADGQWAGQTPACKENIYCLQPPTIEHARHSALPEQATFDLDATVQYHCHNGYVTNGFPRAKCLAIDGQASWYGPDISCEPRSCGPPGDIPHGWVTADCHTYNCRALLQCGAGFELVGKAERHCQADGTWSPKELPTCVLTTAVQCPPPEAPRHGKAVYTSCAYNSVVSYECKYGYKLVGDSTRRCRADKSWSGTQPQCKEINCGHPGQLYNGWLENISAGTGLGAALIFRCHDNMRMIGDSSAVCQNDGTWSNPLPKCMAPCVVPHVTQGRVTLVEASLSVNSTGDETSTQIVGSSTMVRHGDEIVVQCDVNYEFPYAHATVSCNNGTWTHIPKCQPAKCKRMPKPPKDGMVFSPKTDHGMKAKFRCKDGFELKGNSVVTCSYGNWTGEIPKCHQVFCPFPGNIDNGKVLLVGNMGLYDYRPYVKKVVNNKQIMYDCLKGYILSDKGPPGATCIGGFWRPQELPECILGQHPRIRVNRKRRSILNDFAQPDLAFPSHTNHLRHETSKLMKKYDIEFPFDQTYEENDEPMTVMTIFNLFGQPTGHRVYYSNPKYAADDYRYSDSTVLLKGGVFDRSDDIRPVYNRLTDVGLNRYGLLKNAFDIRNKRTSDIDIPELITDETKTIRNKRSLDYNLELDYDEHIESVINDKIHEDLFEISPDFILKRSKRHDLTFNDMTKAVGNDSYDNSVEFDLTVVPLNESDLTKRDKRTSRKTEKINETTAAVPKSGRDYKGKGQYIAPVSSHVDSSKSDQDDNENKTDSDDAKKEQANETSSERPKKQKQKIPCDPLSMEPYVNVEVIKVGRDPNITHSSGTILRVVCGKGYQSNLDVNATVKCAKGRWKPEKPQCLQVPCLIPVTSNGVYVNEDNIELNETQEIFNGQIVRFSCQYGYTIQGPSNLRCWLGEWAVTTMPECVPSPCLLTPFRGGTYSSGHRTGQRVSHTSSVNLTCHADSSTQINVNCHLGRLHPDPVNICRGKGVTSQYLSGSDIVRENVSELEPTSDRNSTDCGPPLRIEGTLLFQDGIELDDFTFSRESSSSEVDEWDSAESRTYGHGSEVTYKCFGDRFDGDTVSWITICELGEWVGQPRSCDSEIKASYINFEVTNESCVFINNETNVATFYNDIQIKEPKVIFPNGAEILSRCIDIGKYSMQGVPRRMCSYGAWDNDAPICTGLNQENDYAMERPPTILFRHQLGPIAQSSEGKLIVYPGTVLHMECLWMRRFGNPKWTYTHNATRKYPEGWTTDPGRDSQLEYRLSIINASPEDSGVYRCETPARQWHQVEIIVDTIHCPVLPLIPGLIPSTLSNKLNTEVQFSCSNSETLVGASSIVCLPNGNWSGGMPKCESIECEDIKFDDTIPLEERAQVAIVSRRPGSRAAMSCVSPRALYPSNARLVCGSDGKWHGSMPRCREITCPTIEAPQYGYTLGRAPHKAGDVLQFHCNPKYTLDGRPILVCQDSGRWSDRPPNCTEACAYPGTTISGRMSSVQFYYRIGETITFTCEPGFVLKGTSLLECLKSRKWSNAVPLCAPINKNATLQADSSSSDGKIQSINISKRNSPAAVPALLSQSSYKLGLMRATAEKLLRRSTLQTWMRRATLLRRDET